jgi:hypothetical protein
VGLFGQGQVALGGLGVAGDHSCTDHDIAWRTRNLLNLDHLGGFPPVSGDPARPDNIVYDITPNPAGGIGVSASGVGHPKCPNLGDPSKLPAGRLSCGVREDGLHIQHLYRGTGEEKAKRSLRDRSGRIVGHSYIGPEAAFEKSHRNPRDRMQI